MRRLFWDVSDSESWLLAGFAVLSLSLFSFLFSLSLRHTHNNGEHLRNSPHWRGASCRCSRTNWLRTPSTLATPLRRREGWAKVKGNSLVQTPVSSDRKSWVSHALSWHLECRKKQTKQNRKKNTHEMSLGYWLFQLDWLPHIPKISFVTVYGLTK